ncbi:OsmC family protein [Stigmatella aurantiaca]|uniref:OsmC-like family protein n=1 Tax=Stigmatella aurantiaca (strain DW4/3-1) TaxID=378806 RepID=Q08RH6_STIAD|nr:hypothetical protein [Stigmatella aurantiaca]ADO75554.1 OsmC-like family protein [Stigmatella aurantiaca DW4/3-1]EAU63091.1 conserved hypothetical protein [Stigmatella aurantiaca DW4/3-1]
MALDRVETQVERDDSRERQGTYVLHAKLAFHGDLPPQDTQKLHDAVARCPIHQLMTSATIDVVTAPLDPSEAGTAGSPGARRPLFQEA